jgi:hypothetical protein
MNANNVVLHDGDRGPAYKALDDAAEYVAMLGAEFSDAGRAGVAGHLPPLCSHAFRKAAALLSVYRSRVDFLHQRDIDSAAESLPDRFRVLERDGPVEAQLGRSPGERRDSDRKATQPGWRSRA